jgi:hypothetical protein
LFPESANKILVTPNLFNNPKKSWEKSLSSPKNGMIRLVFIGTLNKEVRRPHHLLLLFKGLMETRVARKLELHIFGDVGHCADEFIPYNSLIGTKIFLHGVVSKIEAGRVMNDADILVNIGNMNPYQEPSKVVEYASTCKPILNIMAIQNDSSLELLKKYPVNINIFGPSLNEQKINNIVEFIETPHFIDTNFFVDFIRPYKLETIAMSYASMLKKENEK